MQNIISRCRALLSLQHVKQAEADGLLHEPFAGRDSTVHRNLVGFGSSSHPSVWPVKHDLKHCTYFIYVFNAIILYCCSDLSNFSTFSVLFLSYSFCTDIPFCYKRGWHFASALSSLVATAKKAFAI